MSTRVTETEYLKLLEKAERCCLSLSDFIYQILTDRKVVPRISHEEMDILRKLAGQSNNLNQLTKMAHRTGIKTIILQLSELNKEILQLIKYVFGKEKSYLLDSDGVLLESTLDIIYSFQIQSRMCPSLGNKVGHISLSLSPKDKERLTDECMTNIANEYLKGMGITDTQY